MERGRAMPICSDSEKIQDEEFYEEMIAEACEEVLGRRPFNWKEEVQVAVYWAMKLCPCSHLSIMPDLAKKAQFKHLTAHDIRNISYLIGQEEVEKCITDHNCSEAKQLKQQNCPVLSPKLPTTVGQ